MDWQMFIILTVYYLVAPSVQTLLILAIEQHTPSACVELGKCKTIWSIIWNCLVTLFACTWVAVHPNILSPYETQFTTVLRHLKIMLLALIAPELVILWAMQQRLMAHSLAQKYHGAFVYLMRSKLLTDVSVSCLEHRWTEVHGFFAVMGGFMLFNDDREDGTINLNKLKPYLNAGEINITEKEIEDRSKGNTLTKGLVIIQTRWFILQCVARRAENLPVTELELVMLASTTLSFITYWL